MSKVNTLFMVSLLFFMVSMAAARPPAEFYDVTHMETHPEDRKDSGIGRVSVERNCEGDGQEECLMRRTLAAQTDYIYTQKHN